MTSHSYATRRLKTNLNERTNLNYTWRQSRQHKALQFGVLDNHSNYIICRRMDLVTNHPTMQEKIQKRNFFGI